MLATACRAAHIGRQLPAPTSLEFAISLRDRGAETLVSFLTTGIANITVYPPATLVSACSTDAAVRHSTRTALTQRAMGSFRLPHPARARTVGDDQETAVDIRVVAATHRDLPAMVRAGTFRKDLYHRPGGKAHSSLAQ